MMEKLLNPEGPVMGFLNKTGELILLSLLWLLGCLPIVTVAASNAALYYAAAKSVRCGQGSAVKEFLSAYKRNLSRGIAITIAYGAIAVLCRYLLVLHGKPGMVLTAGVMLILALLMLSWVCVGPVLSRFSLSAWRVWKLSFVMALRHLPVTVLLLAGMLILLLLQFFVLPMATVLIFPGLWSYGTTFLAEPALRRFMPPKTEKDNAWYFDM